MTMRVRLKTLRQERGWNQQETADRLGISKSHVSEMESGKKNPSSPMLDKMAAIFGVTLLDLIEDEQGGSELKGLVQDADGLSSQQILTLRLMARAMRDSASSEPPGEE